MELKSKLMEAVHLEQLASATTPVLETAKQSFDFDFVQSSHHSSAASMAVSGANQLHGQYGTWPPDQIDLNQVMRMTTDNVIEAASQVRWLGSPVLFNEVPLPGVLFFAASCLPHIWFTHDSSLRRS